MIAKAVIAMTIIQSSGDSAIDAAAKRNSRLFAMYIVVLLVTAIIIAVFTWLTWDSGNKLQDAIRQDANARIAEAQSAAATLRSQLNAEAGKVAGLQKEASDAKAAQQKVEIDLAVQREKTARAEHDLIEVRKRQEPRNLFAVDVVKFKNLLAGKPNSPVVISCIAGDPEGCSFARQIMDVLNSSGWTVTGVIPKTFPGTGSGLHIHVHAWLDEKDFPVGVFVLSEALTKMGMRPGLAYRPDIPPYLFELIVEYR